MSQCNELHIDECHCRQNMANHNQGYKSYIHFQHNNCQDTIKYIFFIHLSCYGNQKYRPNKDKHQRIHQQYYLQIRLDKFIRKLEYHYNEKCSSCTSLYICLLEDQQYKSLELYNQIRIVSMLDHHSRQQLSDFGKLTHIILVFYHRNKLMVRQGTQLHILLIKDLQIRAQTVFQHTLANLQERNKFFNWPLDIHIHLTHTLRYRYDLHDFPSIQLNSYQHSFL